MISRNKLLNQLVTSLFVLTLIFKEEILKFKEILFQFFLLMPILLTNSFLGDEIEEIESFDPTNNTILKIQILRIFPATIFVAKDRIQSAIHQIQDDLMNQVQFLNNTNRKMEAKRLNERVNYDLEMIRELGYCSGIENYSRYFDGRSWNSSILPDRLFSKRFFNCNR